MPSFLNQEENSNIFNNNPDILNLDPTNQFGLAATKERVNGGSIRHAQSDTINESFDESSISSTHASDVFENNPAPMNGNGTRPTSMSSLSNEKSTSAASPKQEEGVDTYRQKPWINGNALADRTRQHVNGSATKPPLQNSLSKALPLEPPVSEESSERVPSQSFDSAAPSTITPSNFETRGAQSQSPFFTPGPPTPESTQALHRNSVTGHRLSSPPIYNSGNTAASSSGLLHPPPNGGLKQRHTLDVPKAAPRGSKDGLDTAQASGRFSPTGVAPGARRPSLSMGRRPTRSMQSDAPRDEVAPDEDALRWAEAVRQKRASKRKRKEEEDDERVLVGTKVDETHANWVTAYNMLTGIRVSVSRTNAKLDRELTDEDFDTKQKSTFDM